jgi:hypothetical protein
MNRKRWQPKAEAVIGGAHHSSGAIMIFRTASFQLTQES